MSRAQHRRFFFHNTLRRIHWLGHFDPDRQQLLSVRLNPALWLARATYSWNRIRHRRVPERRQPKRSPSRQERGEILGPEFAGCIYWMLTFRSPWRRLSLRAREATKAGFSTEPNVCSHSSLFPPEDDAAWNKGHGRIERSQIRARWSQSRTDRTMRLLASNRGPPSTDPTWAQGGQKQRRDRLQRTQRTHRSRNSPGDPRSLGRHRVRLALPCCWHPCLKDLIEEELFER
jgi:hypothetical protein